VRSTLRSLALIPLLLATIGCGGPFYVLPGGQLSGQVVTETPTDWSFLTDAYVDLETRPGDPYSIELNYVVKDGQLYIDPAEGRRWLANLRADPDVRARFDGKIYLLRAVLAGKPGELPGFDTDRYVYRLEARNH
jgi:hypothetical protein